MKTIVLAGMVSIATTSFGVVVLTDDFDPAIDVGQWGTIVGGAATSGPGFLSGNALWFNSSGTRSATTPALNVSTGGLVDFHLRVGNELVDGATYWEDSDIGERPYLQYSLNGTTWTHIASFPTTFESGSPTTWTSYSFTIPVAAQSSGTYFRWIQPTHSGTTYDHWAIDNVVITAASVPEPSTIFLLGVGGAVAYRLRRRWSLGSRR